MAHLVRFRPGRRTGTQGQQTKQNINLKGNSTENVEVAQNGSTARGQQNRHIIKKGNRIEADLSGTGLFAEFLLMTVILRYSYTAVWCAIYTE